MKTYNTGGQKDTTNKPRIDLVTYEMLLGIAAGMECGLKKGYAQHNWKKGIPIVEGHLGATLRHIYKYMKGEDINIEKTADGEQIFTHHLDNALTHLAMAVHHIKNDRDDLDDRFVDEDNV